MCTQCSVSCVTFRKLSDQKGPLQQHKYTSVRTGQVEGIYIHIYNLQMAARLSFSFLPQPFHVHTWKSNKAPTQQQKGQWRSQTQTQRGAGCSSPCRLITSVILCSFSSDPFLSGQDDLVFDEFMIIVQFISHEILNDATERLQHEVKYFSWHCLYLIQWRVVYFMPRIK